MSVRFIGCYDRGQVSLMVPHGRMGAFGKPNLRLARRMMSLRVARYWKFVASDHVWSHSAVAVIPKSKLLINGT